MHWDRIVETIHEPVVRQAAGWSRRTGLASRRPE
jgi:hypothetical protein